MARTFGTIYLVAALAGFISLAVPDPGNRSDALLAVVSAVSLAIAALCFVAYRRAPMWFFYGTAAAGSVLIAVATAGGSNGAEGGYGVFYVWVVLLAFLFFSFRVAVVQALLAAISYAVVLIARDSEFTFNFMLGLVAVIGAAGAVVGLLRARLERLAANLDSEAHTDSLTGVANRRGFDQRFELELWRAARTGRGLSLIVCDLDHFKAVNDRLGHRAGDEALRTVAARIAASVRSIDAVSRIGGEEFAVLLPEASPIEAHVVAERIRKGILQEFADHAVPLTISCGVASQDGNLDGADLIQSADDAMYRAKAAGRNRSVVDGAEIADYELPASSVK
jgi:diguanylate cyclase (GGDEF)-like protein